MAPDPTLVILIYIVCLRGSREGGATAVGIGHAQQQCTVYPNKCSVVNDRKRG